MSASAVPGSAASPPGPTGDRVAGNLIDFTADPLAFLTRCAREHGDVVALGSHNVLLAGPADIERMLVDRAGVFAKSTAATRTRTRRRGFPTAMMNSDGPTWRAKRDRLAPGFDRDLVTQAAVVARTETAAAMTTIPIGTPIDPGPLVGSLTLRTVTRLMFGRSLDDADTAAVGRLTAAVMDASVSPIALPDWVPTPATRRRRRALHDIDEVVTRIAADPPPHAPVLAALLADGRPPVEELRDELATLVLSGFETTKNAVLWTLDLLARHPEHADAVAAEFQRRHDSHDTAGATPVTSAVLRESLRLYPPAWLTSRETLEPVEFGGYLIPTGTTVTVSQWVSHRDPRWFPDPDRFDPGRWARGGTVARGAYYPFVLGPRACIGAATATAEAVTIVGELCRRFRFDPGPIITPRPALSLQPVGMMLTARPRSGP